MEARLVMGAIPELLLNVQVAAEIARQQHPLEDVLVAAGMPRRPYVDRDRIHAQLVIRWKLTNPDDVAHARRTVDEILSLADL